MGRNLPGVLQNPLPLGQYWMPLQPLASSGTLMWPPKPASLSSPGGGGAGRERHQAWQPRTAHFFLYILYIYVCICILFFIINTEPRWAQALLWWRCELLVCPHIGARVGRGHIGDIWHFFTSHHWHPCPHAWRPARCGGKASPWACAVKGVHPGAHTGEVQRC